MVRFSEISKIYGEIKALDEVSFEIPKNTIVGLVGPTGAGKSTCMKIMAGAMAATSGELFIDDQKIESYSPDAWKKQVGFLPERPPVYEELSVVENLSFWADVFSIKNKKQKISNLIDKTGLSSVVRKPGGSLSKGYRQRLGIAKALISEPELLILDEPLSGLDPMQLDEIRKLIRDLGKEHSVLFSSHQLHELEQVCDYYVFLNEGKLVSSGTSEQIKNQSEEPWLCVEFFNEIAQYPDFGKPTRNLKKDSFEIQIQEEAGASEQILNWSRKQNLSIKKMIWQKPDLEQIFRDLNSNR